MIACKSKNRAFAAVLAGTAIAAAYSASAAPVLTNTAAVKQALASDVQEIRWRGAAWRGGRGRLGGPLAGGLLAGRLISTAIANPCCYDYASYPNPYAPSYFLRPDLAAQTRRAQDTVKDWLMWNEFLPISMSITLLTTGPLCLLDMACSFSWLPSASLPCRRARSTAGPFQ